MKFFLAIATLAAAALLAGCAGGSGRSQSGSSGITMYGTIDEGVTFHK